MNRIHQNQTAEWSFKSSKPRKDPFNEVELSVRFTLLRQDAPQLVTARNGNGYGGLRSDILRLATRSFASDDGEEKLVPAFWAGGKNWRVRFASPLAGKFHFRTVCSDPSDSGLHDQAGDFQVKRYTGSNPLFRHGPIRVAADKRHFEHADGTPFFWLGDTWWMGLTKRLTWPKGFQTLARDRVKKGFSVVQIVAGLYPDMAWRDKRGVNEAGFPWDKDYKRINPAYFDMADRRIQHLVESGLAPCIVGCWGYFLPWMGVEKMKKHWRYLVARYGAYPVTWCLAGEAIMPYYLATNKEEDRAFQKKGWTEVAAYVRGLDAFRRPVTIHPTQKGREQVHDPALLDFEMLQTGHGDMGSAANHVQAVRDQYRVEPRMPVIVGEVCYEGIGDACGPKVQRHMFWTAILNGAAGHTYGANGIWQVNTRAKLYGPSPHGMSWGDTPWEDACQLPGATQLGLAKRLLERYAWWRFEPHPEWVDTAFNTAHGCLENYPAGIPDEVRIVYEPNCIFMEQKGLDPGVKWKAYLFNPRDGSEHDLGPVVPDEQHNWKRAGKLPTYHDWVLVLEAKGARK